MFLRKNKKGQSAIEIAIIFPVVAMLMLYLFDVASVINAKMTVNSANRAYLRILTVAGAPKSPHEYQSRSAEQLKKVKQGATLAENAKLAAISILSQNNLEFVEGNNLSYKEPKFRSGHVPLSTDINFHGKINTVETGFPIESKICTEVPIRLSKILNTEIWGKNKVQKGKLPVCSIYISAISSKSQ